MQENSLRPMDIGSIIDRTFRLYRNNFSAIILFALLIGGTANLIIALTRLGAGAFQTDSVFGALYSGIMNGESASDILSNMPAAHQSGLPILSSFLSVLVYVFVSPLVTGGVVLITLSACNVRNGENGGYFSQVKKIYPKLIGTQLAMFVVLVLFVIALMIPMVIILVAVAFGASDYTFIYITTVIVVSLLAILAFVFFIPYFVMIFPVAIHENKFGFKPVGRTWKLFRKRFWKSIGVVLLTSVIVSALSMVVGTVVAFFPAFLNVLLSTAVTALLTPVSTIAVTLLYLDIRMTVEGYDLELRSAAIKSTAAQGNVDNTIIAENAESVANMDNAENTDD